MTSDLFNQNKTTVDMRSYRIIRPAQGAGDLNTAEYICNVTSTDGQRLVTSSEGRQSKAAGTCSSVHFEYHSNLHFSAITHDLSNNTHIAEI
jgi:hypothetical protein